MTSVPPSPCCVPGRARLTQLETSAALSIARRRVGRGSTEGMAKLDGGPFLMGSEASDTLPGDGEGPVRRIIVDPFYISKTPVTTGQFAEFMAAAGYRTEAERFGWSFVFRNQVSHPQAELSVPGAPWWYRVDDATWNRPFGPDAATTAQEDHPAVHVSFNDAQAYCEWSGTRLPTEAEWEYASRGGLEQQTYPWGDELTPDGVHMCNIWQGTFPELDLAEDGYSGTAPVTSYSPNGYGLYTTIGNVWEWCADYFDAEWHVMASPLNPVGPPAGTKRVLKGGSYLCHASYCRRYRNAARTGNAPDTSGGNIGFRVVRDV